MSNSAKVPIWIISLAIPLLTSLTYFTFQTVQSSSTIIPEEYSKLFKGSLQQTSISLSLISCIPLFLNLLLNSLYRTFLDEPSDHPTKSATLRALDISINNTFENTLYFTINLIFTAELNILTKDQLITSTLIFLISRALYTLGLIISSLSSLYYSRIPGTWLSLSTIFTLVYLNILKLLSS